MEIAAPTKTPDKEIAAPIKTPNKEIAAPTKPPDKEIAVDLGKRREAGDGPDSGGRVPDGLARFGQDAGDDEKPQHRVRITKPFYLGKYLVTQEQWEAVMGSNPSHFKGPKNPVEQVSWDDCQEFRGAS